MAGPSSGKRSAPEAVGARKGSVERNAPGGQAASHDGRSGTVGAGLNGLQGWLESHGLARFVTWEMLGLPVMTFLLGFIFWYLTPNFLTVSNMGNVARQVSVLALVAAGQTLVILSAGIDLSVGSVLALVSVVSAIGMRDHGVAGFLGFGLVVGTLAGLI